MAAAREIARKAVTTNSNDARGPHTGMIEILSLLAGLHMTRSTLIRILRATADQLVLGKLR